MNSFQYAGTVIASIIAMASALLTVNPSVLKNLGVTDDKKTKRVTILSLITICSGFLFSFALLVDLDLGSKRANWITVGAFLLTWICFFSVIFIFAFTKRPADPPVFIGRVHSILEGTTEWKDLLLKLQVDKGSTDSYIEYNANYSTDRVKLIFKVLEREDKKIFTYQCRDTFPPINHISIELVHDESQNTIDNEIKIKTDDAELTFPVLLLRIP